MQSAPSPSQSQAAVYYVHADQLGTPRKLTDPAGTVVWSAQYEPFGAAVVNEDPDGDGKSVTLNLRFPGQYFDGESGLHYNYYRYYDPGTGRYITSDPIGVKGGLSLYVYASANPLVYSDPSGLKPPELDPRLPGPGSPIYDPPDVYPDKFEDCNTWYQYGYMKCAVLTSIIERIDCLTKWRHWLDECAWNNACRDDRPLLPTMAAIF